MKGFNLKDILEGKPICTRNGCEAKFIYKIDDEKDLYPLVVLINDPGGYGIWTPKKYTLDGRYDVMHISDLDLFMKSEKHEGWINLYRVINGETMAGNCLFKTKEEALKNSCYASNYITTIKIEWED